MKQSAPAVKTNSEHNAGHGEAQLASHWLLAALRWEVRHPPKIQRKSTLALVKDLLKTSICLRLAWHPVGFINPLGRSTTVHFFQVSLFDFLQNVKVSNEFGWRNDKNHAFLVTLRPFNSCSSTQLSDSVATVGVWACPTVLPMICYPHYNATLKPSRKLDAQWDHV